MKADPTLWVMMNNLRLILDKDPVADTGFQRQRRPEWARFYRPHAEHLSSGMTPKRGAHSAT